MEHGGARQRLTNFVGGQQVPAEDGPTAPVVDPSTGVPYAEAPVSGPADVDRAVRDAARAFTGWRRTTSSERSLALFRIADAVEARAEDLVRAECANTGKPYGLTMAEEIPPTVDQIRFFAGAAQLDRVRGFLDRVPPHARVLTGGEPVGDRGYCFAPTVVAGLRQADETGPRPGKEAQ